MRNIRLKSLNAAAICSQATRSESRRSNEHEERFRQLVPREISSKIESVGGKFKIDCDTALFAPAWRRQGIAWSLMRCAVAKHETRVLNELNNELN
jgi:hypothetical protein